MGSGDILDVLPCGYVSFNDAGIITSCNHIIEDWIGLSKKDLTGNSIEKIFTLATRIFYNTHFFPLIKLYSHASEIFLSLKGNDNADIPVLANAQRISEGENFIIHCIFIRVEQRKKFEQELLDARRNAENALNENRQLNQLTRSLEDQAIELDRQYRRQLSVNENLLAFGKIISHDLQEPIRKIRVFADVIATSPVSDENKVLARKIEASAEKLKLLTDNLQQYIKIDSESKFTSVDLNTIVEAARKKVLAARLFSDLDMDVEKLPIVDGFSSQLELMFFHLIDNAIQYRQNDRKLKIKVKSMILQENIYKASPNKYKYAACVRISFADNGIGFPDEYKEYVFGLLSKLDRGTPGLGVGLSLVRRVVDNHFGNIYVSSQPDVGTRFEIELPLKMVMAP